MIFTRSFLGTVSRDVITTACWLITSSNAVPSGGLYGKHFSWVPEYELKMQMLGSECHDAVHRIYVKGGKKQSLSRTRVCHHGTVA